MYKVIELDELLRRFADPAAPERDSVREAIAHHATRGVAQEIREMLTSGELPPEDFEHQVADLVRAVIWSTD